jgi:hypothetical protein
MLQNLHHLLVHGTGWSESQSASTLVISSLKSSKMDTQKLKETIKSEEFKSAVRAEGIKEALFDLDNLFYGSMIFCAGAIVYMLYYMHIMASPLAKVIDGLLVFWILGAYLGRMFKMLHRSQMPLKPVKKKVSTTS